MTLTRVTRRGLRALPTVRGVFQWYYSRKTGLVARAWQPRRGPAKNETLQSQIATFKKANQIVKQQPAQLVLSARAQAEGTALTWHDVLMQCAYGTWLIARERDGLVWMGQLVAWDQIQALLDSLGMNNGSLIYREAGDWIELPPPAATNKMLVYTGGVPLFEWQTVPSSSGGGGIAPNFGIYLPPSAADYTLYPTNSVNPTCFDLDGSGMILEFGSSPAAGDNVRLATRALPSTYPANIDYALHGIAAADRYKGFGMAIHGTGVGGSPRTIITAGIETYTISGIGYGPSLQINEWTSQTAFATNVITKPLLYPFNYIRLELTATTYRFLVSLDAATWLPITGALTYTSFITPTDVGLYVHLNNTDTGLPAPSDIMHATYYKVS